MSYDINLENPVTGAVLEADEPHQMKGGTYVVGGTREMSLNITYNYAEIFVSVMGDEGIRTIYGMTGAQSIPILHEAIGKLGNDTDPDYWKATDGNAKQALLQLLSLAHMRPDGVWSGD